MINALRVMDFHEGMGEGVHSQRQTSRLQRTSHIASLAFLPLSQQGLTQGLRSERRRLWRPLVAIVNQIQDLPCLEPTSHHRLQAIQSYLLQQIFLTNNPCSQAHPFRRLPHQPPCLPLPQIHKGYSTKPTTPPPKCPPPTIATTPPKRPQQLALLAPRQEQQAQAWSLSLLVVTGDVGFPRNTGNPTVPEKVPARRSVSKSKCTPTADM